MTPDEMRQAIERTVVDTLRRIHFDGNGCGTHDSGACSVCYGPSPLDATEIAEHLVPAIVGVVAPALEAAERRIRELEHERGDFLAHARIEVGERLGQLRLERDEARAALEAAQAETERYRAERDDARAEAFIERQAVHADLVAILAALGIGDHARPYSSHEVVQREVLPAIRAALAENERLRELLTGRADIAVIRAALDGEPGDKEEA